MLLPVVGVDRRRRRIVAQLRRQHRVVAELGVAEVEVDGVEPEAVDAALQPEARDGEQLVLHLRLVEVEVGLLLEEVVHDSTAAARCPTPRPSRRRSTASCSAAVPSGLASAQTYQLALGLSRLDRLSRNQRCWSEVWLSTRSIITRRPSSCARCDQRVEVGEGAEHRVDVAVVHHVVAEVEHRRGEERRDPDRVDPEAGDVGQPVDDPGEVADAVAVRILERARIDLVDHRAAPPVAVAAAAACPRGSIRCGTTMLQPPPGSRSCLSRDASGSPRPAGGGFAAGKSWRSPRAGMRRPARTGAAAPGRPRPPRPGPRR